MCTSLNANLSTRNPTTYSKNCPNAKQISIGQKGPNVARGFAGRGSHESHESRRCSRDTYPESYITRYTSIRKQGGLYVARGVVGGGGGSEGNVHVVEREPVVVHVLEPQVDHRRPS